MYIKEYDKVRIPFSTLLNFFWREKAKSECDWVVMTSVFVASQSHCFSSVCASKLKSGQHVLCQRANNVKLK